MWDEIMHWLEASAPTSPADGPAIMEPLEGRAMMSASPMDWEASIFDAGQSTNVSPAYHLTQSSTAPASAKSNPSSLIPNCVGNFTGTYLVNAQGGQGQMSVKFTKQKNGALTGTFTMPLIGSSLVSTVNVGTDHTMRGHIAKNGNDFSMTAAVSANGKYITGRWSLHTASGAWKTGIFTITRP